MRINTKRFGELDIEPAKVVIFPKGLIGFPDYRSFVPVSLRGIDESLKWLQSVDDPALGFVTLDPKAMFADYDPELCPRELMLLGHASPRDLIMQVVVTVPEDTKKTTANLQAPLVINPVARLGMQVIAVSPQYTTKHSVFPALQGLLKRTG